MILEPLTDLHMASHPSSSPLKPFIPLWPLVSAPRPLATANTGRDADLCPASFSRKYPATWGSNHRQHIEQHQRREQQSKNLTITPSGSRRRYDQFHLAEQRIRCHSDLLLNYESTAGTSHDPRQTRIIRVATSSQRRKGKGAGGSPFLKFTAPYFQTFEVGSHFALSWSKVWPVWLSGGRM
jgi:hypothetical protein